MAWFSKKKKNQDEEPKERPEPVYDEYEKKLLRKKASLEANLFLQNRNTEFNATQGAVWGLWGIAAFSCDIVTLGGIGTAISLMAAGAWGRGRESARDIRRQIDEIDEILEKYKDIKKTLGSIAPDALVKQDSQKNNFNKKASPDSTREEVLKDKLKRLEKQIEDFSGNNGPDNKPKK